MRKYLLLTLFILGMAISQHVQALDIMAFNPNKRPLDAALGVNYFAEVKAGETISEIPIIIQNRSAKRIDVDLLVADGQSTVNDDSIALAGDIEMTKVGVWGSISEEYFTMAPGEKKTLYFSITFPDNLPPGQYTGGIAFNQMIPQEDLDERYADLEGKAGAVIAERFGYTMLFNVSGKEVLEYDLSDLNVDFGETNYVFDAGFTNKGNILLATGSILTIKPLFGDTVVLDLPISIHKANVESDVVAVPVPLSVIWPEQPYVGFYTATLETKVIRKALKPSEDDKVLDTLIRTKSFNIIPWRDVFILLGVIALLFFIIFSKRHRKKVFLKKCVDYQVKKGDIFFELCAIRGVKWKMVAKVNHVKAPYFLVPGSVIKLPPAPFVPDSAPLATPPPTISSNQ